MSQLEALAVGKACCAREKKKKKKKKKKTTQDTKVTATLDPLPQSCLTLSVNDDFLNPSSIEAGRRRADSYPVCTALLPTLVYLYRSVRNTQKTVLATN